MNEDLFWSIIEAGAITQFHEDKLQHIRAALQAQSQQNIIGFATHLRQKLSEAYTWKLWVAASILNEGCSDDGFYYFRAWLVSLGRDCFYAALQDPDTLALSIAPPQEDFELEELCYLPDLVYQEKTGQNIPPIDASWPKQLAGTPPEKPNEAAIQSQFPRLSALVG